MLPEKIRSRFELSPRALEAWNPSLRAAAEDSATTITMYGVIGNDDYWYGEGVTLSRVDAALRSIGDNPVTVYINSPGGDMFEGIAIYNRLREHSKPVTVKVIGMAASAASVIAMAGDVRQVARSAFLMIHNCWSFCVGNRHELRGIADQFEEFDLAMVDVYVDTSGQDEASVKDMMDAETYLSGKTAVEKGFATDLLDADEVRTSASDDDKQTNALRALDAALAKSGMPRTERRKLLSQIKTSADSSQGAGGGTQNAATKGTQNAASELELDPSMFDEMQSLAASLRGALKL